MPVTSSIVVWEARVRWINPVIKRETTRLALRDKITRTVQGLAPAAFFLDTKVN